MLKVNETRDVDFYTTGGLTSFYLTLWKNFIDVFSIELIIPNGSTTGQITYADQEKVVHFGNVAIYINYGQPNRYNVDQNIFFQIESTGGSLPEGLWKLRIKGNEITDGSYDIWLPITEEVSRNTAFFVPSIDTTLTLPSTALYVLTVGAYKDYIKNVASSEIYCTWPNNTIQANILAILSFTLNRVYTEWYRNKGFDFTITSSTAYDQAFSYGRTIFEEIAYVVDEIFTTYITKPNIRQPLLAQYCDGQRVTCPDWLSQWGSKGLGEQGYSPIDILRYYYGSDVYLSEAQKNDGEVL